MFKAFGINLAATLVATLLSTLATVLLIRYLTPTEWGTGAAALGLGQLAGALLSFGSQVERVRRYSLLDDEERASEARLDALARTGAAGAVLLVGTALLAAGLPAGAMVMCAAGVYASLGATNYFIAARRFVTAGVVVILEKALLFALVSGSILTDVADPLTLPSVQGLTGFLAGLAALVAIRSHLRRLSFLGHVRRLFGQYRSATYVGIASLAPSLLLLDASLVLLLSTPAQAGQFALASRLVAPLSLATTSIVTVLLPFMVRRTPGTALLSRGVALAAAASFFVVLALLVATASWWVPAAFGEDYADAVLPVRLYIANTFLAFFTRILVTAGQARHDDRATSLLVACQVVAALGGIAWGAHAAGATGAALSVVSTNAVLAVALAVRSKHIDRLSATKDTAS